MNPILHIVMGPNGAGRSTFGSLYTDGIPVYDPDKRGMEIKTYIKNLSKSQRKQFYPAYTNDMFEELFDELTADYQWEEYDELRKHCVADSIDFALETPFADNFGLNQVLYFKAHGYHIHGIFFGLNTVAQSIANVSLRVKKKGMTFLCSRLSGTLISATSISKNIWICLTLFFLWMPRIRSITLF